jgi:hypothetical protein
MNFGADIREVTASYRPNKMSPWNVVLRGEIIVVLSADEEFSPVL